MNILEFKDLNFGYNNENCFHNFNMEIEKGDIVTLIGPSGSGKTTLLKMICNQLPNDNLYYKGTKIKECDIENLKREIVVVFDSEIKENTLIKELSRFLYILNTPENEIENRVQDFIEFFDLNYMVYNSFKEISDTDKYFVKILRYLIIKPEFLAIENILSSVEEKHKKRIFEYIKKNNITLLNVTTDLNDSLYGNKIFVLQNFVLILEGNTISVLKTDTLLKKLGFNLPLAIDLSIELNNYDILNEIYTKDSELIKALWN